METEYTGAGEAKSALSAVGVVGTDGSKITNRSGNFGRVSWLVDHEGDHNSFPSGLESLSNRLQSPVTIIHTNDMHKYSMIY